MCVPVGILLLIGVLAFAVAAQMSAHRESEVGLLFTDREYTDFQIAWIAVGLLTAGAAVVLCRRVWRHHHAPETHQ